MRHNQSAFSPQLNRRSTQSLSDATYKSLACRID